MLYPNLNPDKKYIKKHKNTHKIKVIKKYLKDYDWIVWLDSDIIISNNNFNVFDFYFYDIF